MPTVLAIDPSSTLTGYAHMADAMTIIDAGLLKPDKASDPWLVRVKAMVLDVGILIRQVGPDVVLIEVPSAHVAGKRHSGKGAGLAIYGFAAGAMWSECLSHVVDEVVTIDAQLWTRGKPKKIRQTLIEMAYPAYDRSKDKGGDIADAIGLAAWWFGQQKAQRIAG